MKLTDKDRVEIVVAIVFWAFIVFLAIRYPS